MRAQCTFRFERESNRARAQRVRLKPSFRIPTGRAERSGATSESPTGLNKAAFFVREGLSTRIHVERCVVVRMRRGAGRASRAETVAERLRRMGTHVHEDTRYEVGAGRPLANLRHVLGECPGLPDRARRVEGLVVALGEVTEAVPRRTDTAAFLQLTRAAQVALEASDQAVLTDERWRQVDAVLAALLRTRPCAGREHTCGAKGDHLGCCVGTTDSARTRGKCSAGMAGDAPPRARAEAGTGAVSRAPADGDAGVA